MLRFPIFRRSPGALRRYLSAPYASRPTYLGLRYLASIPKLTDASSIIPVLDTIEEKTPTSYNALLKELALEGRSMQAQTVYDKIFRNHVIKANIDTYSYLMMAYLNDGKYSDAMEIYYELRNYEDRSPSSSSKDLRLDSGVYETMIESLTKAVVEKKIIANQEEPIYEYTVGDGDSLILTNVEGDSSTSLLTALTLFNDMRHLEIPATSKMYLCMLKACKEQRDDYVLRKVHKLIRMDPHLDPDANIINHLMEAYYAVGDIHALLDVWDVAEAVGGFNEITTSIALRACVRIGFTARANHVWDIISNRKNNQVQSDDFNKYLEFLLMYGDAQKAITLLQEGKAKGVANEASVNIWEKYQRIE